MSKPTTRKWTSIILLSIILPVSLLTTFRLTGVLREPQLPQTITTETVAWNMTKPSYFRNVEGNITSAYLNSTFSGILIINPLSYWENDGMLDYNDGLWLKISVTANISHGFIYSINVKSSVTDEYAILDIVDDPDFMELTNLMKKKVANGLHSHGALFETMGIGEPKECRLTLKPVWKFLDPNNVDHWITITLETTYFNGTVYQKIMTPIRLEVFAP